MVDAYTKYNFIKELQIDKREYKGKKEIKGIVSLICYKKHYIGWESWRPIIDGISF